MLIASNQTVLIVGGGATGLSAARYLHQQGIAFFVFDTRSEPSLLEPFRQIDTGIPCFSGEFDLNLLEQVSSVLLSPGVSRDTAVVKAALEKEIEVAGDISWFLKAVASPVIGITGSNGKSTVTTMVALAAEKAGIKSSVGGNLGRPALELLADQADLYVLELSSFQLESTAQANLQVAVNLNVSEDHLDRHGSLLNYFSAKQKIFHGAKNVVYNSDDRLTQPPIVDGVSRRGFALAKTIESSELQYWFDEQSGYLMCGDEQLMLRSEIRQRGLHNIENVLALFAICDAAGIERSATKDVAQRFPGLAHRCEFIAEHGGVCFVNDSKATNEGACIAALNGLADEFSQVILIAGGQAKGSSFSKLLPVLKDRVDLLLLIGDAAASLISKVDKTVECLRVESMAEAVGVANERASTGSLVLLSPACASFDMFKGFEHRGESFKHEVEALFL
ncbi:UDP-N-acetylmuramoyl-L-alanine--D-glutamate ligase [Agaribacterium sp. ZY112]|uniref:UDP-N-acetylmuramoyl-L-alanine--D-glutamate ligase n=1 Tax=Agaribacterium sp. ZY112 TaxID=3233574 RepID=UPI003523724D